MLKPVKKAIVEYFTRDGNGVRRLRKSPLGVSVSEAAARFCIGLTITYRAGVQYCCTLPACAFSPEWDRLRERLASEGVAVDQPIRIFLRVVYEHGALFAEHPADRDPVYRPLEEARTSTHAIDEVDGWDPVR